MEPLEQQVVRPKKALKKRPKLTLQQLEVGRTLQHNCLQDLGMHAQQLTISHQALACVSHLVQQQQKPQPTSCDRHTWCMPGQEHDT
jgi:hypothetical protein